MMSNEDGAGNGQDAALSALMAAVAGASYREYGRAIDAFSHDDYQEIIRLAWRHQFDEDRSKFRRELRALQAHVSARILKSLESVA